MKEEEELKTEEMSMDTKLDPSKEMPSQEPEEKSKDNDDENSTSGTSTTEFLLKQIEELKLKNEQLSNLLKEKETGSFRINPSDVYENLKYLQVQTTTIL
jgi:hypothetical protein